MSDETHPRVLYVGNLDSSVTEDFLVHLFGQIGSCRGCKLIYEAGNDLYAFVEFAEHSDAQMALMAMNKRNVLGREMKVNWATSPGGNSMKQDTTNHFHVFVGDMSHEIDSQLLREAFSPFGQISDCKVIRDPQTHKSKGFGFVCFIKKEDAEIAIASMNGQWLGGRSIRTNWANGKANLNNGRNEQSSRPRAGFQTLNYDDVYSQASASNTTVYCGGVQTDLTDQLMRETFGSFGVVVDVRVFQDKGYAFVKMDSKDAAARAITDMHGAEVNGYTVKCSWGKETGDQAGFVGGGAQKMGAPNAYGMPPGMPPPNPYGMGGGYGYGPQMGYWGGYPPQGAGYPPQQMTPQQGAYNMQQYYGGGYGGNYGPMAGNGMQQPPAPTQQWPGAAGNGTAGSGWTDQTSQAQQ